MTLLHGEAPSSGGTPTLSNEDFQAIARLMHERTGIKLTESKRPLVVSRLSKRLRALKLADFGSYRSLIEANPNGEEYFSMVSSLTTNVTKFFREAQHFVDVKKWVEEELAPTAKSGGRVRLWSAGCSSGEEPYSLAATILSVFPDAARFDFKILATDIDPVIIARAKAGRYPESAVAGAENADLTARFTPSGDGEMLASKELRQLITFRELNLLEPWPMSGPFDAIMCRNVVIYFDEETQERLFCRFAAMLREGGKFYLGHSERLTNNAERFFDSEGITSFSRNAERSD